MLDSALGWCSSSANGTDLAYDIGADVGHCGEQGVLSIDGATDPRPFAKCHCDRFGRTGQCGRTWHYGEDEFERARAFVVGGVVRSLEDSAVVAAWYAREQALEPTPLPPDALIRTECAP